MIATEFGAVAQEGHSAGFRFPVVPFQNQLIEMLAHDAKFRKIADFTDGTGHHTFAFLRVIGGGARVIALTGFRDKEGPYPRQRLPEIRWMVGPYAKLELSAPETADVMVELRCRAVTPTLLEIQVAGGPQLKFELDGTPDGDLRDIRVPISLIANQPRVITLDASRSETPPGFPGPLFCTQIVLADPS